MGSVWHSAAAPQISLQAFPKVAHCVIPPLLWFHPLVPGLLQLQVVFALSRALGLCFPLLDKLGVHRSAAWREKLDTEIQRKASLI